MEEVGSSGEVSFEEVLLVLLAVKEGSRFLPSGRVPSRRVRDLAIKASVVEVDSRSCC